MIDGFYINDDLEIEAFKEKGNTLYTENGNELNAAVARGKNAVFDRLIDAQERVSVIKSLLKRPWPPDRDDMDGFFNEYDGLCREYKLTLGHEDTNGAFVLCPLNENNIGWALNAPMWDPRDPYRGSR